MELKEYIELVRQRYQSLSDEEKVALETIGATPAADALAKMFGPEMSDIAKASQELNEASQYKEMNVDKQTSDMFNKVSEYRQKENVQ